MDMVMLNYALSPTMFFFDFLRPLHVRLGPLSAAVGIRGYLGHKGRG